MSENITVTRQSLKALLCDEWVASDKASRYQTQAQETLQELSNVRMSRDALRESLKSSDADLEKSRDVIKRLLDGIADDMSRRKGGVSETLSEAMKEARSNLAIIDASLDHVGVY